MSANARLDLQLPPELLDQVKELAAEHDRSVNGEIRHALRQHVKASSEPKAVAA